jgi:hypothetical protein
VLRDLATIEQDQENRGNIAYRETGDCFCRDGERALIRIERQPTALFTCYTVAVRLE